MWLRPELQINHGGDEAQPSDHLMHRLRVRIQNLERENEQQRAKLVQKGDRVQSLKRSQITLGAECCKLNSRLDAAERDNGHLRADLRKDAGEFDRMRDSMRGLPSPRTSLRGKYNQLKQRGGRLRGALNVLTNGNFGPALFLHMRGQLKERISGNSRRQVGEWVDTAYALWLQDEVDSGESTVTEEDSSTDSEA